MTVTGQQTRKLLVSSTNKTISQDHPPQHTYIHTCTHTPHSLSTAPFSTGGNLPGVIRELARACTHHVSQHAEQPLGAVWFPQPCECWGTCVGRGVSGQRDTQKCLRWRGQHSKVKDTQAPQPGQRLRLCWRGRCAPEIPQTSLAWTERMEPGITSSSVVLR